MSDAHSIPNGGGSASAAEWLRPGCPDGDVVMSSRVRLARNLVGFPFLTKASREDRRQIVELAHQAILGSGMSGQVVWVDLPGSPSLDRNLLVERHLISKQHAKGDEPRAVAISAPDEQVAIMVNEEDHLRMQVMRGGLTLSDAFAQIDAIDDRVESKLEYAFSPRFGYLTACPTNTGTGIRVSVMVHLPALKLAGEIDKVRRAAKAMNLAVRGFYGEGSDSTGDIYQISNQTTLGKSERQILEEFEREIMPRVVEYERQARANLLQRRRVMIEDRAQRALGVMRHARMLTSEEAIELISNVKLGVLLGLVDQVSQEKLNGLLLMTQPAHVQKAAGRELDQLQRRVARAELVRRAVAL